MVKNAIGYGNPERESDVWHLKSLLKAHRDGKVEVYTAVLTIAECQHAQEPSSHGLPSEDTKTLFKNFLSSGQYLVLVQDTILVAERARNLRWVHGICMSGPDSIHAASALEMSCEELLSIDENFHKHKQQFESLAIHIRFPRDTESLPSEYRQHSLGLSQETASAMPSQTESKDATSDKTKAGRK